jgi:hypothetical protein
MIFKGNSLILKELWNKPDLLKPIQESNILNSMYFNQKKVEIVRSNDALIYVKKHYTYGYDHHVEFLS